MFVTTNRFFVFWKTNKEWYRFNVEKDQFELTDKAPMEAVESFELYKKMNNYK